MEETNRIFHNNKIPKEDSRFICLSVILVNYIFRKGKICYPEVFSGECKYVIRRKRWLSILLAA